MNEEENLFSIVIYLVFSIVPIAQVTIAEYFYITR